MTSSLILAGAGRQRGECRAVQKIGDLQSTRMHWMHKNPGRIEIEISEDF
jgi:hypothetical protein